MRITRRRVTHLLFSALGFAIAGGHANSAKADQRSFLIFVSQGSHVHAISDLNGIRVCGGSRSMNLLSSEQPHVREMLVANGAVLTSLPSGELFQALRTGVCQATLIAVNSDFTYANAQSFLASATGGPVRSIPLG